MCNGDSKRFTDEGYKQPKFLLRHPRYRSMIDCIAKQSKVKSICGLGLRHFNNTNKKAINFVDVENSKFIGLELLPLCNSHTESCIILAEKLRPTLGGNTPIIFRDSDMVFETPNFQGPNHALFVTNKEHNPHIKTHNKSKVSKNGDVLGKDAPEKENNYICGGYYFKSIDYFLENVKRDEKELGKAFNRWDQLVIKNTIHDVGEPFEWEAYCSRFQTIFLDIDGTIFKQKSSKDPDFLKYELLFDNAKFIKELHKEGFTEIVLTTARPDHLRNITSEQLKLSGVPYDRLIMGLQNCNRIIVNDKTNLPKAFAVNVQKDTDGSIRTNSKGVLYAKRS
jgi:ribonucleotide monophosphatase NagD (HAD superfamily)